MIDAARVREMFDRMREGGVKTDQPLLWGYFFFDTDTDRLQQAGLLLTRRGYTLVSVDEDELEEDEGPQTYTLHVERVEHHTVESLVARNVELDAFARECGLLLYDGMDVGELDARDQPN